MQRGSRRAAIYSLRVLLHSTVCNVTLAATEVSLVQLLHARTLHQRLEQEPPHLSGVPHCPLTRGISYRIVEGGPQKLYPRPLPNQ